MKVAASIGTGSAEEATGAGATAQVKTVESGMIDASAALPYASTAPRATRAGAPDVVPVPINEQAGGGALASPVELLERAAGERSTHQNTSYQNRPPSLVYIKPVITKMYVTDRPY